MTHIHISIATPGKLRPALQSIPVSNEAANVEWNTQVSYYMDALNYTQVFSGGGMWQGDNGNSVVTISREVK